MTILFPISQLFKDLTNSVVKDVSTDLSKIKSKSPLSSTGRLFPYDGSKDATDFEKLSSFDKDCEIATSP
jgi:hypothetical protein